MRKIIIIISLLYYSSAIGSEHYWINKEINKINPNVNIGIKIKNLRTNKILYQRNIDKYYTFASSLKLLTIFALQEYFGREYLFTSRLLKKDDNYYLEINDPDFSTLDLESLVGKLKETGVKSINGNFYIINDRFTLPAQVEGRMIEDSNYCYGSPVTKVHINKNCLKLAASTGPKLKKAINLEIKELVPYNILNKAVTIPAKDIAKIRMHIEKDQLLIDGNLNISLDKITLNAVINDSFDHVGKMLKRVLQTSNITVQGQVLLGNKPEKAKVIAVTSKIFNQIGSTALKMSDNYITDYLLAEFSSKYGKEDWKSSGNLLKQLIFEKFNIDLTDSVIADGSGLSRYNMITVNQFDEFLTSIYNRPDFYDLLLMLAQPGEQGTLKDRFKGIRIYAKTGTMTGVSSLVGYAFDRNNTPYSFVIVANNYIGSKKEYANLEESIIKNIISKVK